MKRRDPFRASELIASAMFSTESKQEERAKRKARTTRCSCGSLPGYCSCSEKRKTAAQAQEEKRA